MNLFDDSHPGDDHSRCCGSPKTLLGFVIKTYSQRFLAGFMLRYELCSQILKLILGTIARLLCTRHSLLMENLVLRQQLAVFKRRQPRPRLHFIDKLLWVTVRRVWSAWKLSLAIVTPETVVQWQRAGF